MSKSQRSRRRKAPKPESTVEIIDRLLVEQVEMTINGTPTRITVLAAIVFQLFQNELAGDVHASRVLLKYQQLAQRAVDRQVLLTFADAGTASSVGSPPDERPNG